MCALPTYLFVHLAARKCYSICLYVCLLFSVVHCHTGKYMHLQNTQQNACVRLKLLNLTDPESLVT